MTTTNIPYGIAVPNCIPIEAVQQDIGIYKVEEDESTSLLTFAETQELNLKLKGDNVIWKESQQIIKVPAGSEEGTTFIIQLVHTTYDEETLEPIEEVYATTAVRMVQGTPIPPVTSANIEIHSLRDVEGIDLETGKLIKAAKFFFPLTHIKAVIDDHGDTLYSLLQILQNNIDAAVLRLNNKIDSIISGEVLIESLQIVPSVQTVGINKAILIRPNILPIYATHKDLNWESSNEAVATVNNGTVRGLAKGTCTITATTTDGSLLEASCTINVFIQVVSIEVQSKYDLEKKGSSVALNAVALPRNAEDTTLLYTVEDNQIADVTEEGVVTALVNTGATSVTIKSRDGGATASTRIIIGGQVLITDIELNTDTLQLKSGQSYQLTTTITPSTATDKSLTWSSSNTAVATVNNSGKVTAVGAGTCTITVKTNDGSELQDTCEVTATALSFYIGNVTSASSAFTALNTDALLIGAGGINNKVNVYGGEAITSGTYRGYYKHSTTCTDTIYYIMVPSEVVIGGGLLQGGGIYTPFSAEDIKNPDIWGATHADVSIGGKDYKVYGYRNASLASKIIDIYIK